MKTKGPFDHLWSARLIPEFIDICDKLSEGNWLCLLSSHRDSLVSKGKIKSHNSWFYMKQSYVKRILKISPNTQTSIIKKLHSLGIIDMKKVQGGHYLYKMNDEVILQLIEEVNSGDGHTPKKQGGKPPKTGGYSISSSSNTNSFLNCSPSGTSSPSDHHDSFAAANNNHGSKFKKVVSAKPKSEFSELLVKSFGKSKARKIKLLIDHWSALSGKVTRPAKEKGTKEYKQTKTLVNASRYIAAALSHYNIEEVADAFDLFDELICDPRSCLFYMDKFNLEEFFCFSDRRIALINNGNGRLTKKLRGLKSLWEVFREGEPYAKGVFLSVPKEEYPELTDRFIEAYEEECGESLKKERGGIRFVPLDVRRTFIDATTKLVEFWKKTRHEYPSKGYARMFPGSTLGLIRLFLEEHKDEYKGKYYFFKSDRFWKDLKAWGEKKRWLDPDASYWIPEKQKNLMRWASEQKVAFYSTARHKYGEQVGDIIGG